jgi:adenylate cyclase
MGRISLRNIVGKKGEANAVLQELITRLGSSCRIEDDKGNFLLGTDGAAGPEVHPIELDGEILGKVSGDASSGLITRLLLQMARSEAEKKKLGTEVLSLYQEINVIFNFSEQLSQTIEAESIARATLAQAMHSIPSKAGMVVLMDEHSGETHVPASEGEALLDQKQVLDNIGLLLRIGINGQSEILNDLELLKKKGIIDPTVHSLAYASMKVKHRIMGAIILADREPDKYAAAHLKLLVTLALQSSSAIESAMLYDKNIREVKEREEAILRIHEITKKFVPIEFIRSLGKDLLTDVRLGDLTEKVVTILFSDIRDYTTIAERMTPEENFLFVSSFNEMMGPIIREHNGFVMQYLGDAIMAIFPGQTEEALKASLDMQSALRAFNERNAARDVPSIRIGIGLHTGPLIMGITGDEQRLDATTISDAVNTAARIESLTKYYKAGLLLSSDTLGPVPDHSAYTLRHLGLVQVKGKSAPVSIYECCDGYPDDILANRRESLPLFQEGMRQYHQRSFSEAIRTFESVMAIDPQDMTTQLFRHKAETFLSRGVPENWNGVEEMMMK